MASNPFKDIVAPVVDIHTHVYTETYLNHLRSRTEVPFIRTLADGAQRMLILPGEDDPSRPPAAQGRPLGPEYYSIEEKLAFMDKHCIQASIISLANPWLDPTLVSAADAIHLATKINQELSGMCAKAPQRLWSLGTLPMHSGIEAVVAEIERIAAIKSMRGAVFSTAGAGAGLDDERLDPVWAILAERNLVFFLHPHHGLSGPIFGPRAGEYGHVLPLALGFPLESTIAISRMILGGVFTRHPKLQVLVAHSGGTLPFLAGRLESCILHDRHLKQIGQLETRKTVQDVLRENILLDAVVYSASSLRAAAEVSGSDRVLFGTDHPFFPPLDGEQGKPWLSVTKNRKAIAEVFTDGEKGELIGIVGGNAIKIFRLME